MCEGRVLDLHRQFRLEEFGRFLWVLLRAASLRHHASNLYKGHVIVSVVRCVERRRHLTELLLVQHLFILQRIHLLFRCLFVSAILILHLQL